MMVDERKGKTMDTLCFCILQSDPMEAFAIKDKILITVKHVIEGQVVVETTCNDFDDFKRLPDVISYNGTICGKTGWSSDTGYACYKSGVNVAQVR